MYRFFCPSIRTITELPQEEMTHAVRVLRLKNGDQFEAFDGDGGLYECVITEISKKTCVFEITNDTQLGQIKFPELHVAIAPTKNNDRLEWFLEKATEIGISSITPILCSRSERKIIKQERLHKILMAACKQSQRLFLPKLNEVVDYTSFIDAKTDTFHNFIAHCEDLEKIPLKDAYTAGESVCILIGPEGDFSLKEIEQANNNGYKSVSLNTNRLRTETAALVACHTIQLLND